MPPQQVSPPRNLLFILNNSIPTASFTLSSISINCSFKYLSYWSRALCFHFHACYDNFCLEKSKRCLTGIFSIWALFQASCACRPRDLFKHKPDHYIPLFKKKWISQPLFPKDFRMIFNYFIHVVLLSLMSCLISLDPSTIDPAINNVLHNIHLHIHLTWTWLLTLFGTHPPNLILNICSNGSNLFLKARLLLSQQCLLWSSTLTFKYFYLVIQ